MIEQHMAGFHGDSKAWLAFVWISFVASVGSMGAGVVMLPVDLWAKGFMGMGLLFVIGSCVSLSKTVRDQHEARRVHNVLVEARAERMMKELDDEEQEHKRARMRAA